MYCCAHAASASGRALSSLTSSETRRAHFNAAIMLHQCQDVHQTRAVCTVTPPMLHLCQDVHQTRAVCTVTPLMLHLCQDVHQRRAACFVNPHMLHLCQDLLRAVKRLQGHVGHILPLRSCYICVRTCSERLDVVRDTHSVFCQSVHAASASGRSASGQTLSEARISCFVTPYMLDLRRDVHRAARRLQGHAEHVSLIH